MSKTKVYFRADGNSDIGLGHVIRSLSIAEIIKEEFDCSFIIKHPPEFLKQQITEVCESIVELDDFSNLQYEAKFISETYLSHDKIIVLDGYKFQTTYQSELKASGVSVVCVDDIHNYKFKADAIINHAGGISQKDYDATPSTKFYLGLKHVILRKEFTKAKGSKTSQEPENDNIFICLGGADPKNDTLKILKLCKVKSPASKYFLVLGGAYKFKHTLIKYLNESQLNVTIMENLNAEEMANYMKKCSTAITSPSTISYEYLAIGGSLYLHKTADNQNDIYKYFISEGLSFPIESFPITLKETLDNSIKKQQEIFDGNACSRILNIFRNLN